MNRTLRRVPGVIPAARRVRCLARAIAAAATSVVPVSIAVRRTLRALRARPGWVPSEGIELVDGLNVALRQLGDADGGNRWLHHRWLAIFDGQFDAVAARLDPRADFDVLCMGAGSRGPLALPLLLFLGGARCIHVVDPELDDTLPDWRLRWGLQEMALRVMTGDIASPHFVRRPAAIEQFVDLRRLFFGTDVRAALRTDTVRLLRAYVEDCRLAAGSIGLVTSRSVLEHVADTARCFDTLAELVKPGGMMYHDIDLTAHADDPFAFYFEESDGEHERRTDGLNGLRIGDYVRAFESRGFDAHVLTRTMLDRYDLVRRGLRPRFRDYGEDDLRCSRAVLVCQKRRATAGPMPSTTEKSRRAS